VKKSSKAANTTTKMAKPSRTTYTAITNHGFGHATRTAAVLADLQQRSPAGKGKSRRKIEMVAN
jgi:hypothetical protein